MVRQRKNQTQNKIKYNNNKPQNMNLSEEFDTTQETDAEEIPTTSSSSVNSNEKQEYINTPSQKRLRDVLQNSLLGNVCKTPRLTLTESPLKFITIMEKRFDKLSNLLETMLISKFNECKQDLLHEFDKRFSVMKTNIDILLESVTSDINNVKDRVTELETVVNKNMAHQTEIEKLKNEIFTLKMYAQKQENSIVACDIRITGIPSVNIHNDNLVIIYEKLCNALKIEPISFKTIYRVKNIGNRRNIQDAPIIIKFHSPYDRNYMLRMLTANIKSNKSSLQLNQIGIMSTKPFFVNENLTPANHHILIAARKLKNENKISSAYTNRGLVYIRKLGSEESLCIHSMEILKELFPFQNNEELRDEAMPDRNNVA